MIDRQSGLLRFLSCSAAAVVLVAVGVVCAQDNKTSLVKNGNFETADKADSDKPDSWFKPDGLGVQWTNDPASTEHGKCIRMDTSISEKDMQKQWEKMGMTNFWNIPKPEGNAIADTYGLSYYSDAIPVKSGQTYRVTFDFKGRGNAKVWVIGYGQIEGRQVRRYEKIVNCEKAGEWKIFTSILSPTKMRPDVTEMKVMLFAYHPAGIYWFDNVSIEEIDTPPPKTGK